MSGPKWHEIDEEERTAFLTGGPFEAEVDTTDAATEVLLILGEFEGASMIALERARQVEEEDWTAEHDDRHSDGSLAWAAVCYAAPGDVRKFEKRDFPPIGERFLDPWPWDAKWDKRYPGYQRGDGPGVERQHRIRDLTKAGALIAAEIDRLIRKGPQYEILEGREKGQDLQGGSVGSPHFQIIEGERVIVTGRGPIKATREQLLAFGIDLDSMKGVRAVGFCSECGLPQYDTPSGPVCEKGHGGARPLECGEIPKEERDAKTGQEEPVAEDS